MHEDNRPEDENMPWVETSFMDQQYSNIPNNGNTCIRLRGADGNYLSLLPCGIDPINGRVTVVDLATPDGKVIYCSVPNGFVNEIIEHLGLEKIR